ncbi:MAG: hypothetical protein ACR2KZ_20505 [Segetibacter sp.]
MTKQNLLTTQPIHRASARKRMFQGGAIALVLILLFLSSGGWFSRETNPEWGKLWMIRPLIIVLVAGTLGGVFNYFTDHLRYQGGWNKIVAIILSLFGYIVALWFGQYQKFYINYFKA